MTRRAPLPKITECTEKKKTLDGLGRARLIRAAYPFAIVCALCLAHIHLQFLRTDLLVQQNQLQGQQRVLHRQQAALEGLTEQLCDVENLKTIARRDMNMLELKNATEDRLAHIPHALQEKYRAPLSPMREDVVVAEIRNERQGGGLKNALWSLLDSSRAMAAASPRP